MHIKKKKTLTLLLTSLALVSLSATLFVSFKSNTNNNTNVVEGTEYSLIMNDGVSVTSDYGTVTNEQGTTFGFAFTYYTAGSGSLGSFTSDGHLLNWDAFHSIQSITINLSSGSYDLYTGWKQYESSDIEYSTDPFVSINASGNHIHDLSSINPSYFKIDFTSDTVVNSVKISYTCASSTKVANVRMRIAAPTVGGTGSINEDNCVWVNTNIQSSESWENYLMNEDTDGSWYYDFTNVDVASDYTYTLVVCEKGSAISWSHKADNSPTGFAIGEGQIELNVNDVNFASQPEPIASSYKLNLTINTSGTPSSFGNMQFIYNYSNSTSDYGDWGNYISYSWASSYDYSFEGLDTSKTLYFKIYMWSDNKNIYVGNGSANFSVVPTGKSEINATLTFTYSATSTITGSLEVEQDEPTGDMYHSNVNTTVYGTSTISPTYSGEIEPFTASYSGENIRIDNNSTIVGLVAGTTTKVTLTSLSGLTCSFNVKVASSNYVANYDSNYCGGTKAISVSEGWFNDPSVSEISSMGSDFINGVDISSFKALIDNGAKFYNSNGVEQHLMYILKDAGVNWIRAKLWVDPYTDSGTSYGGGESDLEHTLWIAKEAKAAGLKFLLDFHYSDYWADPAHQIIPKSWNDCTSATALQARIKSYTTETLNAFKSENALPDMVQLGNEISSGIYRKKYSGSTETFDSDGAPSYFTNMSDYSYGTNSYASYANYIKAAAEGVNAVSSSIKKVIHWAKGSAISAATINNFFSYMPSSYYDYAAISFYPFYCFDTMSDGRSILNGLSLSKPWFVAESSYPFSGNGYTSNDLTSFLVSYTSSTTVTNIKNTYAYNAEGQANMIHDLTDAVASSGGLGIFYWEAAWIPTANVGWAGSGSKNTWGNQGFFSFDGKAIGNLKLFAQMSPYID